MKIIIPLFSFLFSFFLSQNTFASWCGENAEPTSLSTDKPDCRCTFPDASGIKKEWGCASVSSMSQRCDPPGYDPSDQDETSYCPTKAPEPKCADSNATLSADKEKCVCKYAQHLDEEPAFYSVDAYYNESTKRICYDKPPTTNFCPEGTKRTASNSMLTGSQYVCQCTNPNPTDSDEEYNRISPSEVLQNRNNISSLVQERCPQKNPNEKSFACLQDLEKKIRACSDNANNTMNVCSDKEDSNAKIKNVVNNMSSQVTAVSAGGAEGCSKTGALLSAAAYGEGMMRQNCNKEIVVCENSCNGLQDYEDVDVIAADCRSKAKNPVEKVSVDTAEFKSEADRLAKLMFKANEDCASDRKQTKAEKFLESTKLAADGFVQKSQASNACAAQISSKAVPLMTLDCALNGGGPGCPLNCITNQNDISCKTLSGTGLSTLAALPPIGKLAPGNVVGGLKNAKVDLGKLDLSGVTGDAVPSSLPQTVDSSSNTFGAAAAAQAGGGAETSAGPGDKGKDKNSETAEEKSFFSGTIGAMKNAVSSIFSGSRSSTYNKNSSVENMKRLEELNRKNSIIRGLANTGNVSCYVDSVGARFCLGRKNKTIFDMMSAQYGNQKPTFLKDGG